jgi:hypothetical protein
MCLSLRHTDSSGRCGLRRSDDAHGYSLARAQSHSGACEPRTWLGGSRSIPRRWKKAPNEPASIATAEIAYACRNTSSTRAGDEIGFGSCDETVSSCVLVQKTESPNVFISVPVACRSNMNMSTLATAPRTTVATNRKTSRERRCSCVGVAARATLSASRLPSRTGSGTPGSVAIRAVGRPAQPPADDACVFLKSDPGPDTSRATPHEYPTISSFLGDQELRCRSETQPGCPHRHSMLPTMSLSPKRSLGRVRD